MELRFLPSTMTTASGGGPNEDGGGGGGTILTNNNQGPCSYPSSLNHHPTTTTTPVQQQQNHIQQNHIIPSQTVGVPIAATVVGQEHLMLASMPHRRTLERSMRNLQQQQHNGGGGGTGGLEQKMMLDGDCGVTTTVGAGVGIVLGTAAAAGRNNSSMRRTRRGSGSVPGSPRVGRGPSAELLQHNRSPMPIRAAASGVKRAARLGRAENMSSGSLNSIEV